MKNNFKYTENGIEIDISEAMHCGDKNKESQSKKKEYSSYGSPDISKHYFKSKDDAMADAKRMGLSGVHSHKDEDGKVVYMAGPDHESFMKKHKEVNKKSESAMSPKRKAALDKNKDGKVTKEDFELLRKKGKKSESMDKKQYDKIDKKELKQDSKKEKAQHEKDAIEDDKSKIKKLKKGAPSEKKDAEKKDLKKDIKYDKKSAKSYAQLLIDIAAERFGGKKRGALKDSDFLDPKRRSFPVMSAQDVKDAVSSWGRYKGSMSFDQFKAKLIRRAKKIGAENALPKSWAEKK